MQAGCGVARQGLRGWSCGYRIASFPTQVLSDWLAFASGKLSPHFLRVMRTARIEGMAPYAEPGPESVLVWLHRSAHPQKI